MLIEIRPPADPDLRALVTEQRSELAAIEGEGHINFPLAERIEYVVGLLDGEPVACGALQHLEPGVGEVKRMYVRPAVRGRGLARRILAAIEERAVALGLHTLRLETGRFLAPALNLYASSGYTEIPLFGHYTGHTASICFEKRLESPVD